MPEEQQFNSLAISYVEGRCVIINYAVAYYFIISSVKLQTKKKTYDMHKNKNEEFGYNGGSMSHSLCGHYNTSSWRFI